MNEEQRLVQKRLRVLEHVQKTGNVRKTCRYFGIGRSSFYRWKSAFDREGEAGLVTSQGLRETIPINCPGKLWIESSFCAGNIIWARFVLSGIWRAITVSKSVMPQSTEHSAVMV